jgi:hypothetical protein
MEDGDLVQVRALVRINTLGQRADAHVEDPAFSAHMRAKLAALLSAHFA